mmetsp:Transcript_4057/g.6863  ORF Transcript_4057/g.6863 Transcript_4057/m.6863 type:complete len:192 (-) Transcript_4057:258-833(-)
MASETFGADTTFRAAQFHFHSGSEHTIDNKRYDLEMHTVHFPLEEKNGFIAAALGIMFSVDDYNTDLTWSQQKIVDTFFETLKWDSTTDEVAVDLITYGSLVEMVEFNRRWIYKGSVTTPTCATYVYWNVLSTVYPISQKHLDMFRDVQLAKKTDLKSQGNYREIQEINEHNVHYVNLDPSSNHISGEVRL